MFVKILAASVVWCLSALPSYSQLAWDQPVQEFQKSPADKQVEAKFSFRNSGSTTVTITSIQTSCGCTTASVDKKTYEPGEKGQITAVYNFFGHTGTLHKTIAVSTDSQSQQAVALEMRVLVNEPLQAKPSLVYWRIGEAAEPKTVQLIATGRPVHITKVTSSNPRLAVQLRVIKADQEYSIQIRPSDTGQKESAQISIASDGPGNTLGQHTVYALVK